VGWIICLFDNTGSIIFALGGMGRAENEIIINWDKRREQQSTYVCVLREVGTLVLPPVSYGFITMIFWGTNDFISALVTRKLGNWRALLWSLVFSLPLFAVLLPFIEIPRVTINLLGLTLVYNALSLLAMLTFFRALEIGKVALIAPLAATWPVVTVFLSILLFAERPSLLFYIGFIILLAGVLLILFNLQEILRGTFRFFEPGIRTVLIATLCFGISFAMLKPISREVGWFFPMLSMRLFVLPCIYVLMRWRKKPVALRIDKITLLLLMMYSLFEILGQISYNYGVMVTLASLVAGTFAASPIISFLLAKIFLREKTTLIQNIGVLIIVCGLVLVAVS
jgi:drug/metabolite transporter (DMT)-like permease